MFFLAICISGLHIAVQRTITQNEKSAQTREEETTSANKDVSPNLRRPYSHAWNLFYVRYQYGT
jgi:hypothetical protein